MLSLVSGITPVAVIWLLEMAALLEAPANAEATFTFPLTRSRLTLGCSAVATAWAVKLLLTFREVASISLSLTFAVKDPLAFASTLTAPTFTRPTPAAVASVQALA